MSAPRVMRSPRKLDLSITSRCNLRCRYCYVDEESRHAADLPTAEWLRFFDELGQAGVMSVCLAGGEPFIREDLELLLAGVVRNRMRFSLLSNGTLIDEARAEMVARTRRCDYVQVSLDGSRPETHDSLRGAGTFVAARRGLECLQRQGVPVTVRVTIHRHNVADLQAIARLLLEDLGLPQFSTNAAGYLGSCRVHAREVLLDTSERQQAMETLLELAARYPGRITAMSGPLAEARHWQEMEHARANAVPRAGGGFLTACGCSAHTMAVRADGVMIPCTLLPHLALGRINSDALLDVWLHGLAMQRLRERQHLPLEQFAFCAGCPYTPYCTGNCPALAYGLLGEVDHPSPDACLRTFLRAGGRLPNAKVRP